MNFRTTKKARERKRNPKKNKWKSKTYFISFVCFSILWFKSFISVTCFCFSSWFSSEVMCHRCLHRLKKYNIFITLYFLPYVCWLPHCVSWQSNFLSFIQPWLNKKIPFLTFKCPNAHAKEKFVFREQMLLSIKRIIASVTIVSRSEVTLRLDLSDLCAGVLVTHLPTFPRRIHSVSCSAWKQNVGANTKNHWRMNT